MTQKEKAEELVNLYCQLLAIRDYENKEKAKQCALITVERNINTFTELVNKMDDFSNESRQVIWQLIDDENEVKQEIEKL